MNEKLKKRRECASSSSEPWDANLPPELAAMAEKSREKIRAAVEQVREDHRNGVPVAESYKRFMRTVGLDPRRPG